MDDREANRRFHPPACTCTECTQKRLHQFTNDNHTQLITPKRAANASPKKERRKHRVWRFSPLKLLLNIMIIACLPGLVFTSYNAFTHKWAPLSSTIAIISCFSALVILARITTSRRYNWRTPSFTLTFWCAFGIALVATFAGVEPLSDYKDKAFKNLATWIQSQPAKNTQGITPNTVTPSVTISPSQPATSKIQTTTPALRNADAADYAARFNAYRQSKGLPPLTFTDDLNRIAKLRLPEIQANFSHTSPGHYNTNLGENIAQSTGSLSNQDALSLWQKSPPHNENILDSSYHYTGYAAGGGYAIQVFSEFTTVNGSTAIATGLVFHEIINTRLLGQ